MLDDESVGTDISRRAQRQPDSDIATQPHMKELLSDPQLNEDIKCCGQDPEHRATSNEKTSVWTAWIAQ